jgi:hypothetical protein
MCIEISPSPPPPGARWEILADVIGAGGNMEEGREKRGKCKEGRKRKDKRKVEVTRVK